MREGGPDIIGISNDRYRNGWIRWWNGFLLRNEPALSRVRGAGRVTRLIRDLGDPMRWIQEQAGIENFNYPATAQLLNLIPTIPDIIHCHNLHGGYFDLRCLPQLSQQVPTILNLRDAWLLSGHCAFSFECDRWKHGCGKCPDLTLFPAINRDATAFNWNRKRKILGHSRVFVTTPSRWLMQQVQASMVAPAIIEARIIPNGVNTEVFSPSSKYSARIQLSLQSDAEILLIAANGIRNNIWKDYKTLRDAIVLLGKLRPNRKIIVVAIGESAAEERFGNLLLHFVPFQNDPLILAQYYRAADIYVHTAKIESFGNVLLEARACGTPVVATAVGGIPEHVKALQCGFTAPGIMAVDSSQAHGVLTAPGDSMALAKTLVFLLDNPTLLHQLGLNGLRDIRANFSISVQVKRFLNWYREIVSENGMNRRSALDQLRSGNIDA